MDGEGAGCLDLGSGGGVPGLILAAADPARSWTLLDAGEQRTAFLEEAVLHLGLQHPVSVVRRRAEEAGRGRLRQACDVVVARGFAAPGPTAECASPLITVGGCLLVAEPPGAPDRWPVAELRELGLEPAGAVTRPVAVRKFRKSHQCPDRYPRRTGVPTKRPLF